MTRLVTRILAAKRADVSAGEREINERNYRLYLPAPKLLQAGGLTPAKIKIVEGARKG